MPEKNSFQWFGVKSEGLLAILLIAGMILHFKNTLYPMGEIAIGSAMLLIFADVAVTIQDKYRESKRRLW